MKFSIAVNTFSANKTKTRLCDRLKIYCLVLLGVGACGEDPPAFSEAQVLGGMEVSAEELNYGRKLYLNSCASCHGANGDGSGPAARHLAAKPRDFRKGDFLYKSDPNAALPTNEDLMNVVRNGVIQRGMPAWKGFQTTDIQAVVNYIKTFSPKWQSSSPSETVSAHSQNAETKDP